MPLGPETDLDWTAFRYVAGELTPAEASAFELRLGDDQRAREAVAEAVELAGALSLVTASDATTLAIPRRRSSSRRALAWSGAAVAAAACVLAYLAPVRRSGRAEESNIARAWSGLRAAPDGDWSSLVAEAPHEPAAASDGEVVSGVESDATAERGVPSWMLAAAAPPVHVPAREGN